MSFLKSGWRLISMMKDGCLVTSSVFSPTALGSWIVRPSLYFASVWNLKAKLQSQPRVFSSLSSSEWFVCALWHINMAFDLHQDPALHAQPLSWQCFSRHSSVFVMGALVCYVSCHQGPQTERLKITEMYCTIDLEARRPRRLESGCWQGHAPSETKQTGFLAPSVFWWGLLLSLPWLTAAFISVFTRPPGVSPSLLSMRTPSYWLWSPPQWSHLKMITSAKILFPNKVTFTGAGGLKISMHPFWGHYSTHTGMEPCFCLRLCTLCHQVPVINPTGPKLHVIL